MNWLWLVAAILIWIGYGLWRTSRKNNDPLYHMLLSKLFLAAEVSDDIRNEKEEMLNFISELKKMIELDGGYKTGKKLAHLATMIPHYGNVAPVTRSRASLIIERVIRNGVAELETSHLLKEEEKPEKIAKSEKPLSEYLDNFILENELQNFGPDYQYFQKLIERHIGYIGNNFKSSLVDSKGIVLILIEKSKVRSNQKRPPKLRIECTRINAQEVVEISKIFQKGSKKDRREAKIASCLSLFKNELSMPRDQLIVTAACAILQEHSEVSDIEEAMNNCSPLVYCLWDKQLDKLFFFVSFCLKATFPFNSQTNYDLRWLMED